MKEDIKKLLSEYCLTPNKALGQNFLADDDAAQRIAALADAANKSVLEIGPGLGAITGPLLDCGARVAAVEIDARMAQALTDRFQGHALTVIQKDFLKVKAEELKGILPPPFTVAANLPYYATTPICTRLLTMGLPIERMVLMVQKDAAPRFTALPGDRVYGPVAVLCSHLFCVEEAFSLLPESYWPEPNVESCVVVFTRRETVYDPRLHRLLTAAFAMRRKTLLNNLKSIGLTAQDIQSAGISPGARAEALSTDEFVRLCSLLPEKES